MLQTLSRHAADLIGTTLAVLWAWDSIQYGARVYATDRPFLIRSGVTVVMLGVVLALIWLAPR